MRRHIGTRAARDPGPRPTRLSRNVLYLGVGRFSALLLSFLSLTVLARRLGPNSLGSLQFALAAFVYIGFAVDLGLPLLGARDYASHARNPRLVGQILGTRLMLAALVIPALGIAAAALPISTTGRMLIIGLAVWVAAASLNLGWVLQGAERFLALGVVETGAGVAQLMAAIWLVHSPTDLVLGAVVIGVSLWGAVIGSWMAVRPVGAMRPSFSRAAAALIRRATPLGVAALAIGIYYSIDALLLGLMRTDAEVAYYAIAYRIVTPFLVIAVIVGTVALPAISRLLVEDANGVARVLKLMTWGLLTFGLPAAAGTAILATPLVTFLFGAQYRPAGLPLAMLIWSVVIVYANAPFGYLMIARGQHRQYMLASLGGAIVNVALNLLLIPSSGVLGAATATIATELVVVSLIGYWTRDVSLRLMRSAVILAAPATLIMGIALWPFRNSLIAIPLGAAVYAGGLLASAALRRDGRDAIRSGVRWLRC